MPPESRARTTVRRHPERGHYDRQVIDAILDEAIYCHVGFVHDGHPFVIPTIHARKDDVLLLHGSTSSRMLRTLAEGTDVCVTVTLVDGVVLARSVFNHSVNYRSVVMLGRAQPVPEGEKREALKAIVEHMVPGRSVDAREPNEKELAQTSVLWLPLDEVSAKVRSGPSKDAKFDVSLPVWAGVIPMRLLAGEPLIDSEVPPGVEVPRYVREYRRGAADSRPT
jgi:nitroimidazol reductase NimA-like FMN-containing flavoprotein (pyridoxamine 5'-phosphate oxidase superfamily)